VIDRATDVIGDRDEALRWIGTPVPALDYATPISLLATSKGKDRVLATLDNLEHGVL
jgi:putative toxin-antitoxin system antitoxin component (TIGR02293 family)